MAKTEDNSLPVYKMYTNIYINKELKQLNFNFAPVNNVKPLAIVSNLYITLPIEKSNQRLKVDLDHYDRVKNLKWWFASAGHVYTKIKGGGGYHYAHRFLTNCPTEMNIDHKNRIKTDCTMENMRICTQSENIKNKCAKSGSSSKYKGVSRRWDLKKWTAKIKHEGKQIHLGAFDTELEAGRVYNHHARLLHGEYAYLNIL